MDIITLAKKVDKAEFKEALNYINQVNDAGLILEFFDLVMEMEREERRRIRELTRKWIELYLQGKYELEEGEVLEEPDEEEDYIIEIVIQQ